MKREIIFIVLIVFLLQGCAQTNQNSSTAGELRTNQSIAAPVEKIEVYHFHGTNQCYSCKTVGAYAEETVNTYFADELKSGKIVFAHINGELPENRDKVIQYGATGSSLWIGVYDSSGFHKEENVNVWYKINNKDDYLLYLRGIINKRLKGDYSQ